MKKYDFLVIGGGVAGLTYALKVAEYGSVAVLFKKGLTESSTAWAQGGVAAVSSKDDNYDLHIQDTLIAGAGLCHKDIVELVVNEGPDRVDELIQMGVSFDKEDGDYHLHKEGGHSRRRIYHFADHTGYEIQKILLMRAREHPKIEFLENTFAIDLITTQKLGLSESNQVLGAYVLFNNQEIQPVLADKILMATGGAGKIYLYTSNPDVATGDGIAMCYRAGVPVSNMEFFQFHPTCLYHPKAKNFLITEAMRGEGAKLTRINGEEFMKDHHELAELAPRDIVARAIDFEMKKHGEDYVLLDITHRESKFLKEHFPKIYETCLRYGIDLTKEPIPVVPAAHYCCGGVKCDEFGFTGIENLYVAGEVACTGLHGANRLASNSLLEGMVFGERAAKRSLESFNKDREFSEFKIPEWDIGTATDSDEQVVITQTWDEIRRFMWNYVGIVRTNKRLNRALSRVQFLQNEIDEYYWNFIVTTDLLELRNLCLVSELTIKSAMQRKESRGLHYTLDYPEVGDEVVDTILTYPKK